MRPSESRGPCGQVTAPGGTPRCRNRRAGGGHRRAPIRRGTSGRPWDPSAGLCSPTTTLSQTMPVPPRAPLRQGRICGSGLGQRPPCQLDRASVWVRGVPAVRITPHAMKSCGRRAPSWVAESCGAAGGEPGSGTGERGRGERSASEEVMGRPAPGSPGAHPWDLFRLCCVGCSLGAT